MRSKWGRKFPKHFPSGSCVIACFNSLHFGGDGGRGKGLGWGETWVPEAQRPEGEEECLLCLRTKTPMRLLLTHKNPPSGYDLLRFGAKETRRGSPLAWGHTDGVQVVSPSTVSSQMQGECCAEYHCPLTSNLAFGRLRKRDLAFEVILNCVTNSRPAWTPQQGSVSNA